MQLHCVTYHVTNFSIYLSGNVSHIDNFQIKGRDSSSRRYYYTGSFYIQYSTDGNTFNNFTSSSNANAYVSTTQVTYKLEEAGQTYSFRTDKKQMNRPTPVMEPVLVSPLIIYFSVIFLLVLLLLLFFILLSNTFCKLG